MRSHLNTGPATEPSSVKLRIIQQVALNAVQSVWADLGLFVVTLGCAYGLNWQATDLVWGLWISSLSIGYLTLIFGPFVLPIIRGQIPWRKIWESRPFHLLADAMKTASLSGIAIGVFVLIFIGAFFFAFFTVHFGMFHFVHGSFLISFFPLPGVKYPSDPWRLPSFAIELLRSYWPLVLTSALSGLSRARTMTEAPKGGVTWGAYRSVIRMHCLIFVFGALKLCKAGNFAFTTVILFAYFFPWRVFRQTTTSVEVS